MNYFKQKQKNSKQKRKSKPRNHDIDTKRSKNTSMNPFDVRPATHQKHKVAGQKVKGGRSGSLMQSRTRAIEKRKQTLLKEFQQMDKDNEFIDRRFGENDPQMSIEEKNVRRFELLRKEEARRSNNKRSRGISGDSSSGRSKKAARFSLADQPGEDVYPLTHDGVNLDFNDDEKEQEGDAFDDEEEEPFFTQTRFSRSDALSEVILKSKIVRAEKKRIVSDNIDMVDELNIKFKDPDLKAHLQFHNKGERRVMSAEDVEYAKMKESLLQESRVAAAKTGEAKSIRQLAQEEIERLKEASTDINDDYAGIPFYIPDVPTFEQFLELVEGRSISDVRLLIRRILSCHHPALSDSIQLEGDDSVRDVSIEHNSSKISRFFSVLLKYICHLSANCMYNDFSLMLKEISMVAGALRSISLLIPVESAKAASRFLLHLHEESWSNSSTISLFPPSGELFLLNVICDLFLHSQLGSTTHIDFHRTVIIPAIYMLGQQLAESKVVKGKDLMSALFTVSVSLHYITLSKQYMPELIVFFLDYLTALSRSCSSSEDDIIINDEENLRFSSHFLKAIKASITKGSHKKKKKKKKKKKEECNTSSLALSSLWLPDTSPFFNNFSDYILPILSCTFNLFEKSLFLYSSLPSFPEIASPFVILLSQLIESELFGFLPLISLKNSIVTHINNSLKYRHPLALRQFKPEPIRSIEPKFDEEYVPKRDNDPNKDRARQRGMERKLKMDRKAAARELRKDNAFISREKLKKENLRSIEVKEKRKEIAKFIQGQKTIGV